MVTHRDLTWLSGQMVTSEVMKFTKPIIIICTLSVTYRTMHNASHILRLLQLIQGVWIRQISVRCGSAVPLAEPLTGSVQSIRRLPKITSVYNFTWPFMLYYNVISNSRNYCVFSLVDCWWFLKKACCNNLMILLFVQPLFGLLNGEWCPFCYNGLRIQ